jgi:hypothetical protein
MMFAPIQKEFPIGFMLCQKNITTFIVVGWKGYHYAFLEINVKKRYVLVKDGLMSRVNPADKWMEHVMFMLYKWGLIKDATNQIVVSRDIVQNFSCDTPTTPEGVYQVVPCMSVVQRNATECGPIAAFHAWEIINPESKPKDVQSFRHEVIDELVSMWNDFDSCLRVRVRISRIEDSSIIIRQNVDGVAQGTATINDDDCTDDDEANKECMICNSCISDPDSEFVSIPCKHSFHIHCMEEYQRECLVAMGGLSVVSNAE